MAFGFDWPQERAPDRPRTLIAKGNTVWIWPGIPLTERRGSEIMPVTAETIRFWITRLHGPEALDKEILRAVAIAADCLKAGNERAAQAALDSLRLIELSQDGAQLMRAVAPHVGVAALDLPLRATMQTWTAQDIALHLPIYKRHAEAARSLAKGVFKGVFPRAPLDAPASGSGWDPTKHPRWPAGAPDSQGGEFAPGDDEGDADVILVGRRRRYPKLQAPPEEFGEHLSGPGMGHNINRPKPDLNIPEEEPPSEARYPVVKNFAETLEEWLEWGAKPWVRNTLIGLASIAWLRNETTHYYYQIKANLDSPKTLKELQDAVRAAPWYGYQVHHIVEFNKGDNFPEEMIESPANLVRIPQMKHKAISDWYQTPNDDFIINGRKLSPSEYLRGKSWDEQYQFGLDILRKFGVLK